MSEENKLSALSGLAGNPKVLYGVGGAVLLGVAALMMSGGSSVEQKKAATISMGQAVTLTNPNGGNSHITAAPGLVGASSAEEDQDSSICLAPAGTKATIEEEQIAGMVPFVKVKITGGECDGKTGWTSKFNVEG